MRGPLYTAPRTNRITGEPGSPTRRAQRLGQLHADLVSRFGPEYPLAIRVGAQLAAARTLAGLDDEVQR